MYYKFYLILGMLLFMQCHSQPQNCSKEMEEKMIELLKAQTLNLIDYPVKPMYSIQVNTHNTRVVVRCNDMPHWIALTENYGESMTLYLNNYIPKSGKQKITVEVWPNEGVDVFPYDAVADVRLQLAADKFETPITDYQVLATQELPEDIGSLELPYYEMTLFFEAQVPHDFSAELATATDLSQLDNIEDLAIAKHNHLKELMESGQGIAFVKELEHRYFRVANYLYATQEDLLSTLNKSHDNDLILFCSDEGEYRKIPALTNYELVFGLDNKVVMMRSKNDKKGLFNVYVGGEYEDPSVYTFYFYMPAGSNELKVW